MPVVRKNEKNLQRTKRGRIICKSTEIYGRNDIGCGTLLCKQCVYRQPLKPTLSKNIYLIPDCSTIKHQIDVITAPSFLAQFSVILLQTIIESIKESDYRLYKRIESEVMECDKHNGSIYVFMNKLNKNTNSGSMKREALIDVEFKQMIKSYKWYETHLKNELNETHLFIIGESAKSVKLFELMNVSAIRMDALIKTLFPSELSNLRDSLSCVVQDSNDSNAPHYKPYWSMKRVRMELKNNANSVFKGTYHSMRGFGANASGKVNCISIIGLNNINRAIHEDIVIVNTVKRNADGNEGEIVCVVERNWRPYCGSLQITEKQSGSVLFVPIDAKIPKIKMKSSQISSLMKKRIIVHIDEWKTTNKYPLGHYTESIGDIGDLETETQVLLLEHDIPYNPWSDAVLQCLPVMRGDIDLANVSDLAQRRNLIAEGYNNIFSVDPIGCVDIDDALHCKTLVNGNIEIGVHIADVSYYVSPNSALDIEAQKRATSVYLVDRRIDMLPSLLSTDLCSLQPNKTRLSFSVFWEIKVVKANAVEIVSTSFSRCVIHSAAALSYGEAQDIINNARNTSEIAVSLRRLLFVSSLLKKDRMEQGALSLSSLQPKFKLNKENHNKPERLESYKLYETNSMIEEFMLFANISVAKKILNAFPSDAMLRRHPKPTKAMLSSLIKCASIRGFKIDIEDSKQLSLSLDRCIDVNDKSFNELIRIITTRCMTQAVYFVSGSITNKSDYKHYGLATPIYTHFTSPIRRYADIIVHRQLAQCCGYSKSNNSKLRNADHIVYSLNRRHRLAQYINRASSNLYTLMFFDNISSKNKPIICSAIISGIGSNCMNVFVSKYCMERRIYLHNKHEWTFDSLKLTLTKLTPPSIKYQVFDKVSVKIFVNTSKHHRKKLIVDLIDKNFNVNLTQQNQLNIPVFCD